MSFIHEAQNVRKPLAESRDVQSSEKSTRWDLVRSVVKDVVTWYWPLESDLFLSAGKFIKPIAFWRALKLFQPLNPFLGFGRICVPADAADWKDIFVRHLAQQVTDELRSTGATFVSLSFG